jgi:hypothetical protein
MAQSTDSFVNELNAAMAGVSPANYLERMLWSLENLGSFAQMIRSGEVNSWEAFDHFHAVKSVLCSLSCYTFNNKLPQNDEVWKLEAECAKLLGVWTRKQLAKPAENRMIRYLLWNRYYVGDTTVRQRIMDHLIAQGYILKKGTDYVVKGLYTKVGDNVFTVGRDGRESRQYVHVCLPQYYTLHPKNYEYLNGKEVPEFEDSHRYSHTNMQDGKGCARHPKVTYKDWNILEAFAFPA